MPKLESGILDKTRILANILMLVLLAGNIFFSVQYIEGIKNPPTVVDNTAQNIKIAHFLNEFITVVLNTNGSVSFDDRVKLEDDVRQLNDPVILTAWEAFVNSTTSTDAQQNAIKLMSILSAKMV